MSAGCTPPSPGNLPSRRIGAAPLMAFALVLGAPTATLADTLAPAPAASGPSLPSPGTRASDRAADSALTGGSWATSSATPPVPDEGTASSIRASLLRALERVAGVTTAGRQECRWPDAGALAAILPVATDRGSHASGVVIAPDRVLTAAHAVVDGGRVFVRLAGGYRAADLLLLDRDIDVAVLGVDTYGIAPLPIALEEPTSEQPVWAVGYPREAGRTTSSGVFQRTRGGALHTSAPIDSGQSGGGLLACERGAYRLLGMLRGYGAYRRGSDYVKLANHSVAVAASTIHRVLAGGLQDRPFHSGSSVRE